MQAYQDGWLKRYYPLESYSVLLSLEPDKNIRAIKEMVHFGIEVTNPDVNHSKKDFTFDFDSRAIRYGLIGIDGIGEVTAEQIMEKAPYESLIHFEMSHSFKYTKVNKGHRQALLEAGALDALGAREGWLESERAETESRRLGVSLRPGGTFGEDEPLVFSNTHRQEELPYLDGQGDDAIVAGKVKDIRRMHVKRGRQSGKPMALVRMQFGLDIFDLVFFPASFEIYEELIDKGRGIIARGRVDDRSQIIVNSAMDVEVWLVQRREKHVIV